MRTLAPLALSALVLVLPTTARAAITPTRDANALASSITGPSTAGALPGASLTTTVAGNPVAVSTTPLAEFPLVDSSFAILTSGDATLAQSADQANFAGVRNGGAPTAAHGNAQDVSSFRIDLDVPPGANCVTLGFRFLSEEYPRFVGLSVNDGFIAQLDRSDWTGTGNGIDAPGNFAFDSAGQVVSVNTMPLDPRGGPSAAVTQEAAGTIYGGATPRLSAAQAIPTSGRHSLFLSIFDQGDQGFDSAVFVDRLSLLATEPGGCTPGAQSDEVPPAMTLGVSATSADDATPTFSGSAGDAPGDGSVVTVKVYSGGAPVGAPVQTLTANRSGTGWSVEAAPLSPGTYTAQAEQADIAGNTGFSAPFSFNVAAPPQPPPPLPPPPPVLPVLGKSVVVGVVSGTVRIKLKNGKFRTLGANEVIPLGSTIDATKGRVRLTSAAGRGGKVQTADFYQGMFVVTQTKGSKPVTQLALSGKLTCGKASASARKKVRRLWGNGKGRFRTKGRHGAATVKGTQWLTEDRCNGTLFRVKRGVVSVRDFRKKKTVLVKKGKSYLAKR